MGVFCPHCGNLLLSDSQGGTRLFCPTCPYYFAVRERFSHAAQIKLKQVDAIFGGEAAWKNATKTNLVSCEKCSHVGAYFLQIQIRSADEPTTTFYRCCNFKCGYQWRDG
eukprot:m51a1_g4720 putative rna polymerase iii (110) ;mRNA; f:320462-320961